MNVLKKTAGFVFLTFLAVVLFASITHNPLSSLIASGGRCYDDDIVITSPDGEYSLIIKEWGTIGGTGAEVYSIKTTKVNALTKLFAVRIGDTWADDCCYPFRDGDYIVEWHEDSVTMRYFSGRRSETSDPSTWRTQTFELEDGKEKMIATGVAVVIFIIGMLTIIFVFAKKKKVNVN